MWTKFGFAEDLATGDLTPEARKQINDFVCENFVQDEDKTRVGLHSRGYAQELINAWQVLWFKNWASLKSVHAVEHFHVLLYDPCPDMVRKMTHKDIDSSDKPRGEGA